MNLKELIDSMVPDGKGLGVRRRGLTYVQWLKKLLLPLRCRKVKQLKLAAMYDNYHVSVFGEPLGRKPDTPCTYIGTFTPFHKQAKKLAEELYGKQKRSCPIVVLHMCDNPECKREDHIMYGTASDNKRDALIKGRCKGSAMVEDPTIEASRCREEAERTTWLIAAIESYLLNH